MPLQRSSNLDSRLHPLILKRGSPWCSSVLEVNRLTSCWEVEWRLVLSLRSSVSLERERHKSAIHSASLASFQLLKVVVREWPCTSTLKELSARRGWSPLRSVSALMNSRCLITLPMRVPTIQTSKTSCSCKQPHLWLRTDLRWWWLTRPLLSTELTSPAEVSLLLDRCIWRSTCECSRGSLMSSALLWSLPIKLLPRLTVAPCLLATRRNRSVVTSLHTRAPLDFPSGKVAMNRESARCTIRRVFPRQRRCLL